MEAFNWRRDALIADVHAGRMDMVDAMQQVLKVYGDETDKARKQARRIRIRRQYEQDGYKDWQPNAWDSKEEDRINRELKEGIFFASMQNFSDEECGNEDGEEGEDEDEDENGEWEDEGGEEWVEGEEAGEKDEPEKNAVGREVDGETSSDIRIRRRRQKFIGQILASRKFRLSMAEPLRYRT
jgi:hypothetical protein